MPRQETFYQNAQSNRIITVIKTYDQAFVRQAFDHMDEQARATLWATLGIEESYESSDIPGPANTDERAEFLLDELLSAGREDWRIFSYFVVLTKTNERESCRYVSADWPSAESYAKLLATKNPLN